MRSSDDGNTYFYGGLRHSGNGFGDLCGAGDGQGNGWGDGNTGGQHDASTPMTKIGGYGPSHATAAALEGDGGLGLFGGEDAGPPDED